VVEFTPQSAPPIAGNPDLTQLSQWAQRELERLSQQLTNSDLNQYNVQFVAPDRPREGMTVVADGTRWNPGSGAGFYLYQGGAWKKLLDAASADALFLTPSEGDALFLTQAEGDARYVQLTTQKPAFSVVKNAPQTGLPFATTNLITWQTEVYDRGNFFESHVWTPPAGLVSLKVHYNAAGTGTINDGAICTAGILKNGSTYKQTVFSAAPGNFVGCMIAIEDVANGSDTYAALSFVNTGVTSYFIDSNASNTCFMGHWISP
jgi:hypothetical protein